MCSFLSVYIYVLAYSVSDSFCFTLFLLFAAPTTSEPNSTLLPFLSVEPAYKPTTHSFIPSSGSCTPSTAFPPITTLSACGYSSVHIYHFFLIIHPDQFHLFPPISDVNVIKITITAKMFMFLNPVIAT